MPRPNHLFQQLLANLRRLLTDSYLPGETIPSSRVLAAMFGVAQGTAHRALSVLQHEDLIESEPQVGWKRRSNGKRSRSERRKSDRSSRFKAGIITPRRQVSWDDYAIYRALMDAGKKRGIELVPVPSTRIHPITPARRRVELFKVPWNTFDVGLLVDVDDAATLNDPYLRKHRVLAVDIDASTYGISSVPFDNFGAGLMAAQHLIELGHRRFAVSDEINPPGWPSDDSWIARRHGFEAGVLRAGGCIRPEWRVPINRWGDDLAAPLALESRLAEWSKAPLAERPTALFYFDDQMIDSLFECANRYGIRVPADLSLVAVTWKPQTPVKGGQSITNVRLDLNELVARAFDLAEEMVRRGDTSLRTSNFPRQEKPRVVHAPALFFPGKSTSSPPR